VHALKNLELARYVNHLQDENDELRKTMGWLSGHEPQIRRMMETYNAKMGKHLGRRRLESLVVREERRLVISKLHKKPTTKMLMLLNPTHYETNSTQIQIHPYSLTPQMTTKSLSSSSALWGMCSLGRRVRSLVRRSRLRRNVKRNQVSSPNPSLNLSSCGSIVTIVGVEG
jgi:hypothetical protein